MSDPARWLPLSAPHFHVLVSLADGDRHGYAIMLDVEQRTGGDVVLWPASLYGAISKLVKRGLIAPTRAKAESDPRRRPYRITALGRQVLEAEAERLSSLARLARAGAHARR